MGMKLGLALVAAMMIFNCHAWKNPLDKSTSSERYGKSNEPEYNITLGSLFGIFVEPGVDVIDEFTRKPDIFITYNAGTLMEPKMKEKKITILTKSEYYPNGKLSFPCQLVVCKWTKTLSPGSYELWVRPKAKGKKFEPCRVTGSFKLKAPVITSVRKITGDNSKCVYLEVKGKYFSFHPVIHAFINKTGKTGKVQKTQKRCKMESIDIDRVTGDSVGVFSFKLPKDNTFTLVTENGEPLVELTSRIATSTSGLFGSEVFTQIEYPSQAYYGKAAFTDLDGDGDTDMVLGTFGGETSMTQGVTDPNDFVYNNFPYYYENTGTAAIPVFTRRAGEANPFVNCKGFFHMKPTFGDLDGDGDIDFAYYNMKWYPSYQMVEYFENVGSATAPQFEQRSGDDNPFGHLTFPHLTMSAELIDIDGDGDLDLTTCNHKDMRYYENIGTTQTPNFVDRTKSERDPFRNLVLSGTYYNLHAMADVDGDGDPDLVTGACYSRSFYFYLNVGTPQNPVFEELSYDNNPLKGFKMGSNWSSPAFGDVDGDGDPDLISGAYDPGLRCWMNRSNEIMVDFMTPTTYEFNLNPGEFSTPTFGDLDADGDLDMISGCVEGDFKVYDNLGSTTAPVYALRTADNPLNAHNVGACSAPWLADLDGDGDMDLLAGNLDGKLLYFQNVGSNQAAVYEQRTEAGNPFEAINMEFGCNPRMADMDNDGDLDLIVADGFSRLFYYRNDGNWNSPSFTNVSGTDADPFIAYEAEVGYGETIPALADFDKDGDLDMIIVDDDRSFRFFNNIGTAQVAVFKEFTGSTNPLNAFTADSVYASPVFADVHGDGGPVLVIGTASGQLQQLNMKNSVVEGIFFH